MTSSSGYLARIGQPAADEDASRPKAGQSKGDKGPRAPRRSDQGVESSSMLIEQPDLHDLPEVQRVIELGLERGSLTVAEIGEQLGELELDPSQLEELHRELEAH